MIEIVLIVLLIVLLAGRQPNWGWNPADPLGFILSIVLVVLVLVLLFHLVGVVPGRW